MDAKELRDVTIYLNIPQHVECLADGSSMRDIDEAAAATSIICKNAVSYAMVVRRLRALADEIEYDTMLDGFDCEEPSQ